MAASMEILRSSLLQKPPFLSSSCSPSLCGEQGKLFFYPAKQRSSCVVRARTTVTSAATAERVLRLAPVEKPVRFTARAAVTVRRKRKEDVKETVANQIDAYSDRFGRSVVLELISTEIDPRTGAPKTSKRAELKGWFEKRGVKADRVIYTAEFSVDSGFGVPGAVTVLNRHHREFFLESIAVEGFACGPAHFTCNSWVQPTWIQPNKRVFFTSKPCLPSETPPGLRELRGRELKELRGKGKGERKLSDRIYDYDAYNDLGNPDKGTELARPVLRGQEFPYPRRLRTGRPPTDSDMLTESRAEHPLPMYVPRDEEFEEQRLEMLLEGALKALLHNLVPSLVSSMVPESQDLRAFHDVDNLFKEGLRRKQTLQDHLLHKIPLVTKIQEAGEGLLRFDTPDIISKDKFAWLRDDEFARQVLSGINPVSLERLQAFPRVSKLDPAIYGPPESAIKEEHIIGHLDGMSIQQALEQNKLYILDYHDIYLPFLDRINAQDGRKSYGTRTIFFLNQQGTLKPIAIELSLPPMSPGSCRAKRVLTAPSDATSNWLWQLAKAHVSSNDAGVHQLVNHWLRTHACMEPFVIAAHRQLSVMHPIFKLLKPHMRYTLKINALARQILINGGGVIESGFTPGRFCMEMSSAAYRQWRFDQEGLPADLIRRGMAVEDPTQPHGLRLLIADYPYASDGLLLWSAIERWIHTYVDAYYPTAQAIQSDTELQAWYAEAVEVGHADKLGATWWPRLTAPADLAGVLTILVWTASAQHAALNFGQYPLGGYVPARPPLMRRLVPEEGDPEHEALLADPHRFFLSAVPSLMQMTTFMTVIDTLSTHSTDEEYLGGGGGGGEPWAEEVAAAAAKFAEEVRQAEEEIAARNADPERRNRRGAGVLPYELMAPSSGPGITCRGVPNSVSI